MATREELIKELLADPNKLKRKKPFTRGAERNKTIYSSGKRSTVGVGGTVEVTHRDTIGTSCRKSNS